MKVTTDSPQATHKLGTQLAGLLEPGDIVSLSGTLGAGKTLFAKGIGTGLEIPAELITSPTFTLINEYSGKYPLYHFDVYRLEPEEFEDLGYEEYFYGKGICLVEWGNIIESYLPYEYLEVQIGKGQDQQREFRFIAHGTRYQQLVGQLEAVIEA